MTTQNRDNTKPNARLLIGLGGLGTATVLGAYNTLKAAGITYVRTVLVDTDDTRVVLDGVSDDFMAEVSADVEDDRIQVVRLTGANLADWRAQNGAILEGIFPLDLPANVASGAAKLRIVGSAAGLANIQSIRAAVESSMDQVRQETGVDHDVLVVNIVTGSSGGTGSANVLKTAMVVHDVFNRNYDAGQVRLEIRVIIVLPDAYNVVAELRPKVERNAVWTLRELAAAQRDGITLDVPNGNGGYQVSVPPGFIHTIIPISGRSSTGNITTEQALRGMSSFLLLDADPVIGKAMVDEAVDIYPDLEDYSRQVAGVAPFQLTLADMTETLGALSRRHAAQAFLALSPVERSEVTALSDTLLPVTYGQFAVGATLPDSDPAATARSWVNARAGIYTFGSLARGLATMVDGFRLQDETGRSASALRGTDVRGLAESLVPVRFSGVNVSRPSINLDPDDLRDSGSAAVNRGLDEVDRAVGDYRRSLQGFFGAQGSDVRTLVSRFVDLHGNEDLSGLGSQLRTAFTSLEQGVPAENDVRGNLGRIASQMGDARHEETRPRTFRELFTGKPVQAVSSSDHAADLAGRVSSSAQTAFGRTLAQEWNAWLGRIATEVDSVVSELVGDVATSSRDTARRWNTYVSGVQRTIRGIVATLDGIIRYLQDVASAAIPEPEIPVTTGYRQVIGADVNALAALLPAVNTRAQATGVDVLTNPSALLEMGDLNVSTGELLTSNPVVNREIARILRGTAFLSFNPSRCGGHVVTRIFMSGPAELQQHPVVKERTARRELRFEVVEGDQVNIVVMVIGVKLGAISGVEAWERQLHGQRNDLAVSALPFLKLGTLVEINEAAVVESFLSALVLGLELPETEAAAWSEACCPDAMLRFTGTGDDTRFLVYPYPGKGRRPFAIGGTLGEAWEAFKLDVEGVRTMSNARHGEIVKALGLGAVVAQIGEFVEALQAEVENLDAQALEITGSDPASLVRKHQIDEQADAFRAIFALASAWVEDKRRAIARR